MFPEPTRPRRRRAAPAPPSAMTPLFAVPDAPDPARSGARAAAKGGAKAGARRDRADLLAVTAERLRRALGRSFLRYGVPGDVDIAVHAAMNVVEPVLDARDSEIVRLRRLVGGKLPGR